MKKSRIIKLIIFYGIAVVLASCFKDPGTDLLLNSGGTVEIDEATTSAGAEVSKTYNKVPGGPTAVKDSIRINLIGPQRGTAINVTFAVDPTSTAVANVHYKMTSGATITIPANKSYGFIYFTVNPQVINVGEVFKLKVNITAADVPVSTLYNTFTRAMRISCPWQQSSFVGAYNALEPGYGTYATSFVIDVTNVNGVINTNFWDVGAQIKYVFNSANGTISIPTQTFVYAAITWTVQNGTTGTSSYDACIGKFIVPYKVTAPGQGTDDNIHTFTKQ